MTKTLGVLLATTALLSAGNAMAQTEPSASATVTTEGSDIIVTARKKAESAQDVPSTLTVLSSDRLAATGLVDTRNLQQLAPSLAISPAYRETFIAIRGVSNNVRSLGADPSVSVNFNGVYLPRTSMVLSEIFDIERIEVLKGPQGDLYGRNATGGAINLWSQEPGKTTSVDGYVGAGSNDLRRAHLGATLGNETFSVRLAGAYAKDDGYSRNIFNGMPLDRVDFQALRGNLRWQPTGNFKITAFWQHTNDRTDIGYATSADPTTGTSAAASGFVGIAGPTNVRTGPYDIRLDLQPFVRRRSDIAGLTASYDFGWSTLRSTTGYTHYSSEDAQDADGTSYPLNTAHSSQRYRTFSQELQLLGSSGPVDWTIGTFYYEDHGTEFADDFIDNGALVAGVVNPTPTGLTSDLILNDSLTTISKAVYGQLSFRPFDSVTLIAGGRYTNDIKRGYSVRNGVNNVNGELSFSKFTPSGQIQWKPSRDIMLYGSVSTGFKSGGFNFQDNAGQPAFRPENITAFEIGFKSELLNRRLLLNLSAYHYDYSDIQLRQRTLVGNPPLFRNAVTNASSAKVTGFEVQSEARLTPNLSINADVSYTDSKIRGFLSSATRTLLDGIPLPMAPRWSGTAGVTYTARLGASGSIRAHVEYSYRSTITFPYSYGAPNSSDPQSGVVNATLRWSAPRDRYYVELIGRNLTNDLYRTFRNDALAFGTYDEFGPRRTVEVRLGLKF